MELKLSSAGNIDLDQNPNQALSTPQTVTVASFEEASKIARAYIEKNYLGGGNWTGGQLDNTHYVSFNGRVWELAKDWKDNTCVYNPQ